MTDETHDSCKSHLHVLWKDVSCSECMALRRIDMADLEREGYTLERNTGAGWLVRKHGRRVDSALTKAAAVRHAKAHLRSDMAA